MNRQSFYYHFTDIYHLLEWIFNHEAMPILKNKKGTLLLEEGIPMFLEYMDNNKALFINGYMSVGHLSVFALIHDDLMEVVLNTIVLLKEDVNIESDEINRLAQYYVLSFSSLVDGWLTGFIKQTPEELTSFFNQIIHDHIAGMSVRLGVELKETDQKHGEICKFQK